MKTYATNIFVSSRKVLAILRDGFIVFIAQRYSTMRDEEVLYPSRKALSFVPVLNQKPVICATKMFMLRRAMFSFARRNHVSSPLIL